MPVTIVLKNSQTPGDRPTVNDLVLGELAINTYDARVFLKQDTGVTQSIVEIATTAGSGSSVVSASHADFADTAGSAATAGFATTAGSALTAISASYAVTASTAIFTISSSYSLSGSYAQTASYALNIPDTASFAVSASHANNADSAISASHANLSDVAISSSYSSTATSASYAISASHADLSDAAILAYTASSADNFLVRGNITASNALVNGTITALTLNVQYITSSTEFITGSTKFGSQLTDTHQFTGSVTVTGSLSLNGYPVITSDQTGSITVLSASYAKTASYVNPLIQNVFITGTLSTSQYILAPGVDGSSFGNAKLAVYGSGSNNNVLDIYGTYATLTKGLTAASFTGSLFGTASQAVSASHADMADFAISASHAPTSLTASYAISASYAFSSSYAVSASATTQTQFTGSFSGSINNLQGAASYVPYFSASQVLVTSSIWQMPGQPYIVINQTNVDSQAPEALYVWQPNTSSYNVISGKGNLNNYLQLNIQNLNSGTSASSDVVATANNGSETSFYIDMGINGEGFVDNGNSVGGANDAYVYSTGNNLHIGNASTGSYHLGFFVGGFDTEANKKLQLNGNNLHSLTGSLNASQGFTGSLFGTASQAISASHAPSSLTASYAVSSSHADNADQSISSSYALTASYALNVPVTASFAVSASHADNADNAISSSYALSASYAVNSSNSISSSYALTASYAISASNALSSSYSISSSYAVSASQAIASNTAISSSYSVSSSYAVSASQAIASNTAISASHSISGSYALTASFALNVPLTASNANTASYAFFAVSASYAATASVGVNFTASTIQVGTINVTQSLNVNGPSTFTGSVGTSVFSSNADTLVITGSLFVTGSTQFTGSVSALNGVTASLLGTASYASQALSSSYALTASYTPNALTSSNAVSASYALSASNAVSSSYSISGSYAVSASHAVNSNQAISASYSLSGSYAISSSHADNSDNAISSSYAISASHADNSDNAISSSYAVSASHANNTDQSISSSYALTASFINHLFQDVQITGSLSTSGSNTLIGVTYLTGALNISGSETIKGYIQFEPVTTNINSGISASYIYTSGSTNDLYFSQNAAGYSNTTRLRWIEGNLYTGLLNGGLITTQSSTVYQISSGSGIIVNLNASLNNNPYPTIQYLNWGNLSQSIAPLTSSYQQAFVGVQSDGTIYQQGTPFTPAQNDAVISIGNVLFQNQSTINGTKTQPYVAYGLPQRQDIFTSAFGPLKLSGYVLAPSGSSTGSLIVGGGTAFSDGANYPVDPNNPSYVTDNGTLTSKIFRYYQSGSTWVYNTNGGAGFAAIDPSQYSNNGTLTAVSPGDWSIQRAFWYPNSVTKAIVVYYGNASYATEAEAAANIPYEPFVEAPNTAANAIYLGAIVISGNGVFTNTSTFKILPGGLFRQVGGSGGGGSTITQTLAGLSDVDISGQTNLQPLAYSTTAGKWINTSFLSASISGNAQTANSASYAATASYVALALSSSYANTASFADSASLSVSSSYAVTSSNSISSSYAITASYAISSSNAVSSSHAISSSYAQTASFVDTALTASFVVSSSYAVSSSNAISSSYAISSSNAISSSYAILSSDSISSSFALTASYVQNAQTASYVLNAISSSYSTTASYSVSSSNSISSSFALTASYALNVPQTASFAISSSYALSSSYSISGSNSVSSSFALTASYALNVPDTASFAISSSYAVTSSYAIEAISAQLAQFAISSSFSSTASYALNAAGISAISVADEGITLGTASYFDFTGIGVTASLANGTASINIGGGGGAIQGASSVFTQPTPANTWSFAHGINSQTPVVEIYDLSYNAIIPTRIYNPGPFSTNIYFDVTQSGYAIISTGGSFSVTGSNAVLDQTSAATTWSFNHNLQTQYPVFTIFDDNSNVIIPQRIYAATTSSAFIYFSTPRTGKAVAALGGFSTFVSSSASSSYSDFAVTSSYAVTASYALNVPLTASNANTASYAFFAVTASHAINVPTASNANTASYAFFAVNAANASTASYVLQAVSSSFASTASYVENANTSSRAVTASYALTASAATVFNIGASQQRYSTVNSSIVGSNNLFTQATGSFTSGFYKYTIASASNARSGEVWAVWNNGNVQYTDNSTVDIGVTTAVTFSVDIISSQAQFNAQTNTSDWTIKSFVTYM